MCIVHLPTYCTMHTLHTSGYGLGRRSGMGYGGQTSLRPPLSEWILTCDVSKRFDYVAT